MLIHHDTEWPPRRCSGESCHQGRRECKTPEACQLPEGPSSVQAQLALAAVSVTSAIAVVLIGLGVGLAWPYVRALVLSLWGA